MDLINALYVPLVNVAIFSLLLAGVLKIILAVHEFHQEYDKFVWEHAVRYPDTYIWAKGSIWTGHIEAHSDDWWVTN